MGTRQGVKRLREGIKRPLTPHELARGYVFISNDKHIDEILDTRNFSVEVEGLSIPSRRLDVSGRVHIPRQYLEKIGIQNNIGITLASKNKLKIDVFRVGKAHYE
jgi:hypothetical protein